MEVVVVNMVVFAMEDIKSSEVQKKKISESVT